VRIERGLDQPLRALTLECWVRVFRIGPGWQGLISQHTYGGSCGFGLFITDQGRPACYFGDGGAFNASYAISDSLDNPLLAGFSLLNRADMLSKLGRYGEARAALDKLPSYAERLDRENRYGHLWSIWIHILKGRMALSERRFPEATEECRRAIALADAPQFAPTLAEAKAALGLAQALSADQQAGSRACGAALALTRGADDPLTTSNVLLAFAEVKLEGGDAQGSLEDALQAQEIFARAGRQESEWRAWLMAALASTRMREHPAAREQAERARSLLAELQSRWGTEPFNGYLLRGDIQLYRKRLDEILAPL